MTPNMNLTQSTPLVTGGPAWAQNIEADLLLIDQHDHTTGKGVKVPLSGLNINSDLPFSNFSITGLKSTDYATQASPLVGASRAYVSGGELYFNDGSGTPVQVTSGGAVNIAGVGGITGLAGTTAAVTYSDLIKTFSFTQDANKAANIDVGITTIREPGVAAANGISIKSPAALAGAYDITLFSALPAGTKYVQLSAAGVLTATDALDSTTIESVGGTIRVKDLGITTAKLAAAAVTDAKLRDSAALSVIGRAVNSSGSPADIAAGGNDLVLKSSVGTLIWGSIGTANISNDAVTQVKLGAQPLGLGNIVDGSHTFLAAGEHIIFAGGFTTENNTRTTEISLSSNGSFAYIQTDDGATGASGSVFFRIDGVTEANLGFQLITGASGYILRLPPSAFNHKKKYGLGFHTLQIGLSASAATVIFDWVNVQVQVTEM